MSDSTYPPDYIKLPTSIACADEDDALLVTMARILGLCWNSKYRRTPPLTPDELADRVGRPRTTLYRHLKQLEDLRWLRVEHVDRRLVLQPLIRVGEGQPAAQAVVEPIASPSSTRPDPGNQGLRQALQEAGILGRAFRELLQKDLDPIVVRAWHLWTWAPEQNWMENAPGYVIQRLRDGERPPEEYVEIARLTDDETEKLKAAWARSEQFRGWPSLEDDDKLWELAPLWGEIQDAMWRARVG